MTSPTRQVLIEGGYILDLTVPSAIFQVPTCSSKTIASRGSPPPSDHISDRSAIGCERMPDIPGLTNAHTHSPENLAAGFCDALQLNSSLNAVWARLDHLSPEEIHWP